MSGLNNIVRDGAFLLHPFFEYMRGNMERKRWNCIDMLRAGSFLLIFLYHYMIETEAGGYFSFSGAGILCENANIHMAKVGVTLFFMISGFGLMYSSREFSLKTYAKKRFWRILIPFYAASLFMFLCKKLLIPGPVFDGTIPKWHIIFTVLGLDGYLKEYGVSTFSLGVGEWFVGCMILMYVCFPLLRLGMKKNRTVMMVAATVFYLIIAAVYQGSVPSHYFFLIKIFDFILGMYLAERLKHASVSNLAVLIPAVLFFVVFPVHIPLNRDYVNTIFCAILFLTIFCTENTAFGRRVSGCLPVRKISQYSYEMFLLHHWGIIVMNRILQPQSLAAAVFCLIPELTVCFAAGAVLHEILYFAVRSKPARRA